MLSAFRVSEADWVVHESPPDSDVRVLRRRLGAHNARLANIDQGLTLGIFIRADNDAIVAGVYGWLWGACLELDCFWVHKDLRGQGVGRRLVQALEQDVLARGCRQVTLDTYNFQAPEFYRKLGYEVFGTIDGYPD
jgi:ribosomal protein S18 acetylase RimI-like enzyme